MIGSNNNSLSLARIRVDLEKTGEHWHTHHKTPSDVTWGLETGFILTFTVPKSPAALRIYDEMVTSLAIFREPTSQQYYEAIPTDVHASHLDVESMSCKTTFLAQFQLDENVKLAEAYEGYFDLFTFKPFLSGHGFQTYGNGYYPEHVALSFFFATRGVVGSKWLTWIYAPCAPNATESDQVHQLGTLSGLDAAVACATLGARVVHIAHTDDTEAAFNREAAVNAGAVLTCTVAAYLMNVPELRLAMFEGMVRKHTDELINLLAEYTNQGITIQEIVSAHLLTPRRLEKLPADFWAMSMHVHGVSIQGLKTKKGKPLKALQERNYFPDGKPDWETDNSLDWTYTEKGLFYSPDEKVCTEPPKPAQEGDVLIKNVPGAFFPTYQLGDQARESSHINNLSRQPLQYKFDNRLMPTNLAFVITKHTPAYYVNHWEGLGTTNAEFKETAFVTLDLVATRTIQPGEQILVDYYQVAHENFVNIQNWDAMLMIPFDIARKELEGADPESGDQEDDRKLSDNENKPLQPDEDEDEPLQPAKKRRIKRKRGEDANE